MATNLNTNGQLPEGFVSPFTRVQVEDRNDDALACVAILTGKPLADVKKTAVILGLPARGPIWVDDAMIAKLLFNLGNLHGTEYKEFTSIAALPNVALLMVDYHERIDSGRLVVFHHVNASEKQQSLSYVIDPADWIDPKHHVTTDFKHLNTKPAWYIEVTPRVTGSGKTKQS